MVRSAPATRGGQRNAGTVNAAARVAAPRRRPAWLKRRAPASTGRGPPTGVPVIGPRPVAPLQGPAAGVLLVHAELLRRRPLPRPSSPAVALAGGLRGERAGQDDPVAVYVGTSGWQYRDWRGTFHPARPAQAPRVGEGAAAFSGAAGTTTLYPPPPAAPFHGRGPRP